MRILSFGRCHSELDVSFWEQLFYDYMYSTSLLRHFDFDSVSEPRIAPSQIDAKVLSSAMGVGSKGFPVASPPFADNKLTENRQSKVA